MFCTLLDATGIKHCCCRQSTSVPALNPESLTDCDAALVLVWVAIPRSVYKERISLTGT